MAFTITDTENFKLVNGKKRIGNYSVVGLGPIKIPISVNDIVLNVAVQSHDPLTGLKPVVSHQFPSTDKSEIRVEVGEDDFGTFEIFYK